MIDSIHKIENAVGEWCKNHYVSMARLALFVVYFWFGALKLIGMSPATLLVESLFNKTLAFLMPFGLFYALFSLFEILIGILFLIRKAERIALPLLAFHLITTTMPLILLPGVVWQGFLAPTLEGQYIIKNILIVACGVVVGTKMSSASSAHTSVK